MIVLLKKFLALSLDTLGMIVLPNFFLTSTFNTSGMTVLPKIFHGIASQQLGYDRSTQKNLNIAIRQKKK